MKYVIVDEKTEGAQRGVSGNWFILVEEGEEKPKRKRRTKAEMKEAKKEAKG